MKWIGSACIAWTLLFNAAVRADTIVFKNGEELEGAVVEKDENTIKLQVEYGTIVVPMARVRRIEVDTPEKIEEREKKKAAAAELAKQMKEEGKVLYKGKWVLEEDKKADEEKIAAAKKKKKEAEEEAKKKAAEVAAKAKADAERLAAAADLADQQQSSGNSRNDRFDRRHNRDSLQNNQAYQINNGTSNYNQTPSYSGR